MFRRLFDRYKSTTTRSERRFEVLKLRRSKRRLPAAFGGRTLESLEPRLLLTTTVSSVSQFDRGEVVEVDGASSTLRRDEDSISLRVDTVGLPAGVYTLSVAAYNNPEMCEGHCGADDLQREEVNASEIFGIGQVVDESGSASFVVELREGDVSSSLLGPGLVNAEEAEIGFTIRSKGPVIPDRLDAQLTTLDEGCDVNPCSDLQMGVHTSPEAAVTVLPLSWAPGSGFDGPAPNTSSRLMRFHDRVAVRVDATELPEGAYTLWVVPFNRPDLCDGECDEADVRRPEPVPSLVFADGGVVDETGVFTFTGVVPEGFVSDTPIGGPGIVDSYAAQIQPVVRWHGPVIEELREEQTTTFLGGCDVFFCENVQLSIHQPVPPPSIQVMSLEATDTGFVAEFNSDFDTSVLNAYDTQISELGPADVVVEGATTGPVSGSLVTGLGSITFISSDGPLAPDTYSVTFRSAEDGFVNRSGAHLSDDVVAAAGDVNMSFTIEPPSSNAVVVSIPDFVRGPGQAVNLPADTTDGIPVSISEGTGVRTVNLEIDYDPALLQITAATVGAGVPEGATVTLTNEAPGTAVLAFSSPAPLPAGASTIVSLSTTVPADAAEVIYNKHHLLDIHSAVVRDVDDNDFPVIYDDGLHLASYFGDVSGNGRVNAGDASLVARNAALVEAGYESFPLLQPIVVSDVSGNSRLNALDASLIAQFSALIPVPQIPVIPAAAAATAGSIRGGGEAVLGLQSQRNQDPQPGPIFSTAPVHSAAPIDHPAVDAVLRRFDESSAGVSVGEEGVTLALEDAINELFE